jgi:hypothetical protein
MTLKVETSFFDAKYGNVILARETTLNLNFGYLNPDYSRCVGVDLEKACFIGVSFRVCGFDSSPTT